MKKMSKEVTTTTVRIALVEAVNGELVSTEQDAVTVIGNPNEKTLHNHLVNLFPGKQFVILERESKTDKYEMEVLEFIKFATPVKPEPTQESANF